MVNLPLWWRNSMYVWLLVFSTRDICCLKWLLEKHCYTCDTGVFFSCGVCCVLGIKMLQPRWKTTRVKPLTHCLWQCNSCKQLLIKSRALYRCLWHLFNEIFLSSMLLSAATKDKSWLHVCNLFPQPLQVYNASSFGLRWRKELSLALRSIYLRVTHIAR